MQSPDSPPQPPHQTPPPFLLVRFTLQSQLVAQIAQLTMRSMQHFLQPYTPSTHAFLLPHLMPMTWPYQRHD